MQGSLIAVGQYDKARKASVTSGYSFHVSVAVFLPLPPKQETVSHPVNAWKNGSDQERCFPRVRAISWAAIYLRCVPDPNATHSSRVLASLCRWWTDAMANTSTSVSTVRITIFRWPSSMASATCKIIRVSASSCEHGDRFSVSRAIVQSTFWPNVVTTCFVVSRDAMDSAKNLNSSLLLSSTRRKSFQL
jgi:hypothetical protein